MSNTLDSSLVAFDVDGNLVQSIEWYQEVFSEVLARRSVSRSVSDGYLIKTTGDPIERQFAAMLEVSPDSSLVLDSVQEWKEKAYGSIASLYDDVFPCLEELSEKGIKMCATSSMKQDHLDRTVRHHRLERYFDFWLGTDDQIIDKKDHKPIIIQKYGVSEALFEENSYLVGDGKGDLRIAEGWKVKGIFNARRGYENKTPLEINSVLQKEGYKVHAVVTSLEQLPGFIADHSEE